MIFVIIVYSFVLGLEPYLTKWGGVVGIYSVNSPLETRPLGHSLRNYKHRQEGSSAHFLPFVWLVVGVLFAASVIHRAEEHSDSLIVSVPQ